MNITLGANFDLLKTNLSAIYEHDDKGSEILLCPTKVNSPSVVTFDEMITEFKSAFGMSDKNSESIRTSLDAVKREGSTFDVNKIKISLQSAFFHLEKRGKETIENEYAVAVSVDMADALPDLGFVKLNSLFVAVWNTQRAAVLQQIGTGSISQMLNALNA
jgi:hypothetical protein